MSPARKAASGSGGGARRPSLGRTLHRALVTAEAVLVLGVVKDWAWRQVLGSSLPAWGKVVVAMVTTIGIFGSFLVVAQRLLARGVNTTHKAASGLLVVWPALLVHAALLFVLFLLYARMLGLTVLGRSLA
jgi:hypothetical protein